MKNRKNNNLNVKLLHKIISVWLVIAVLLPMSVQFVHAFENHIHAVCKIKTIQHLHENQLDCEFNHFLFNSKASLVNENYDFQKINLHLTTLQFFSENFQEIELFSNSSRAPPSIII